MRMVSVFLLIVILATQFSCGALRQSEFKRNRRLWSESKITNYRMTVNLQTTGHNGRNGKFIITVRDGVIESVKQADKPESDIPRAEFRNYKTIETVFNYIESTEKKDWEWAARNIEYDSKLGYPKKVDIDAKNVLDEELFFQVIQFEVL